MRRIVLSALGSLLLGSPLAAQGELLDACGHAAISYSPTPPVSSDQREAVEGQLRFLCAQVVGAMTQVQPAIGMAFSGGAHTLGTATTIGRRFGVPRISVAARATAAFADIPDLFDGYTPNFHDGRLPAMGTTTLPLGAVQGDVSIGVFNGFAMGPALAGLGAVDLLASLSYLPALDRTGLQRDIFNWGAGARIGILQQGLTMPGVSVSGMFRKMGTVSFGEIDPAHATAGDPAEFGTDLRTLSFRAAVSKRILALDLAAGAGYDLYSSNVHFDVILQCPAEECAIPGGVALRPQYDGSPGIDGPLRTAAWNVYADLGLSLTMLNVVGELGYQKAADVVTPDDLGNAGLPRQDLTIEALQTGRFFASLGLRLML